VTRTLDVRELQYCALVSTMIPLNSKHWRGQGLEKLGLIPRLHYLLSWLRMSLSLTPGTCAVTRDSNEHTVSGGSGCAPGGPVSVGIGEKLRTIRQQWQLSLREVEERSLRFAQERDNLSFKLSASWLNRLEREKHELTVNKLIVLADIYNLPTEQLLRSIYPGDQHLVPKQLSSPNATMLLTGGRLEEQAKYLLRDTFGRDQPPDETGLLSVHDGLSPTSYRRGIIGKRDRTLDPMIPAGSIVQIDTQKRAISPRRDWTHEFQRPIYFLMTGDGYVCGWCELDKNSEWLTLVPHPLSPASSRRWKYRIEIENMGRIVGVAIRLAE
jgi:transcriptional regulator with XRE-family HTH domain